MVSVGRKNVLLLTVDALRRDHLGCYGYHRNTSPFIDRLAADSIRFDNAYSASCHTREAVPALITGKYPDEAVHRYYRLRYPPIAEYLQDSGYRTGAFLTAPFLTAANHYDRGFETFQTSYRYTRWNLPHFLEYFWEIAANTHYASGEWVNDQLTAFIRSGDEQPFFAWGHYTDVHAPYNRHSRTYFGQPQAPRRIQYLFRRAKYWPDSITDRERQTLIDAYDNGIRELDRWIKQLLQAIEDVLPNTVVILTADHGEMFGESRLYEHRRFLTDSLLEIPLIVADPDRSATVNQDKVPSVDVPATICDIAGVDPSTVTGRSLFETVSRPVTATCVRRGKRKQRVI